MSVNEEVKHLNLDESWAVRRYKYHRADSGYYLLYHHHPTRRTLGLVASPPGISDKEVGHAKCVVCHAIAPAEALGFLEMCKWQR